MKKYMASYGTVFDRLDQKTRQALINFRRELEEQQKAAAPKKEVA